MYKKGSVVYRQVRTASYLLAEQLSDSIQYQLEEPKAKSAANDGEGEETSPMPEDNNASRTQQDKLRKLRRKAKVVVEHVDIIKNDFWERRPWILSNKPGKLPIEEA